MKTIKPLKKGSKIGFPGGGQLAGMMLPFIEKFDYKSVILDPSDTCTCSDAANYYLKYGFDDWNGYAKMAKLCKVIGLEFEHVNVEHLKRLVEMGVKVFPNPEILWTIQHKGRQKQKMLEHGIPVSPFEYVKTEAEAVAYWKRNGEKLFLMKGCTGGYDGKTNRMCNTLDDVREGFAQLNKNGKVDVIAEKLVENLKEISVIMTRGQDGQTVMYPIAQNVHKDSILHTTIVHAASDTPVIDNAAKIMAANTLARCFPDYVGTICFEFLVNEKTGEIFMNEIAPRVHNSGHWSLDGAVSFEGFGASQFENHIRAMVGLPLVQPYLVEECAGMWNIVERGGRSGARDGWENTDVLTKCGGVLYDYKKDIKPGRKLGHVNYYGNKAKVMAALAATNVRARIK
ncbi:MAG: ATP-grasp domain-containing protein [Alphaproteobacteria bacterium]|nr:ATP-grasp domain-containing protein [Alphaproteobacteria bacterium]